MQLCEHFFGKHPTTNHRKHDVAPSRKSMPCGQQNQCALLFKDTVRKNPGQLTDRNQTIISCWERKAVFSFPAGSRLNCKMLSQDRGQSQQWMGGETKSLLKGSLEPLNVGVSLPRTFPLQVATSPVLVSDTAISSLTWGGTWINDFKAEGEYCPYSMSIDIEKGFQQTEEIYNSNTLHFPLHSP